VHATAAAPEILPTAEEGTKLALGWRIGGLRTFAREIGGEHLLDVPESEWKDVFLSHVNDPSTTFHLNMSGGIAPV
jgi:hypothetical protein